jgi:hypothetical protein
VERTTEDLRRRSRRPKRVKAAAYLHAEGGQPSNEILLLQYIDRFGVHGVLGRKLYAREIYRMITTENILAAYRSSEQATNIATWAHENPKLSRILEEARLLKKEMYGDA